VNFIEYLQSAGSFTTPLCVAMALAMGWLSKDRERILAELRTALADATSVRERRAEDLAESVTDYQEHAAAHRMALERLTAAVRGTGDM